MGWDDNGLNVERRVQLLTGTIVDPTLPYDPDFRRAREGRPEGPGRRRQPPQLHRAVRGGRPRVRGGLPRPVGQLGPVGRLGAHLHDDRHQGGAHLAARFLRLVAARPRLPEPSPRRCGTSTCGPRWPRPSSTDRELPGAYHKLRLHRSRRRAAPRRHDPARARCPPAWRSSPTRTTRATSPCSGSDATTPLFGVSVPIVAHELADPEKGTGIAMICTFGDTTDVTWWRELSLPVRAIVQRDGRLRPVTWGEPGWETTDAGRRPGRLRRAGRQDGQAGAGPHRRAAHRGRAPRRRDPAHHPHVKFWENGSRPLEIVTSQQWFIRYPRQGRDARPGQGAAWWPDFMRVRFENWVNGLIGDWNITRQRFFGVPVPGLVPDRRRRRHRLPLADPRRRGRPARSTPPPTCRPGYDEAQRNQPGGFAADPDVMDTWATSSLTPADRVRLGGRPRPLRPHLPDGHAPAGPRDHPHLAVLHRGAQPLRARRPALGQRRHLRLHRRPRPQEALEVRRQHARRPGRRSSSATAPTPCGTGRPTAGPAWTWPSTRAR